MKAAYILTSMALARSALSAALPSALPSNNAIEIALDSTTDPEVTEETGLALHARFENFEQHGEEQEQKTERDDVQDHEHVEDDFIDEGYRDQDVRSHTRVEEEEQYGEQQQEKRGDEQQNEESGEEPSEEQGGNEEPERPPNTNERGVIDINPLAPCVRACFIHARWKKFDVLNLTPDEFCIKHKIFHWDSFYLGPCMRKNCDRKVAKHWFKETCPKIYDGKSWLTGSPMNDN